MGILNRISGFISRRPILSVAVPGTLALASISYLGWFIFTAAMVPGGPYGSYYFSNKTCQLSLHPENIKKLAKVMNFPFLDSRLGTTLDRSAHIFRTVQATRIPPYLPGTPADQVPFPRGSQRIIDYSINCMYPPFLVNGESGNQNVGIAVAPLPAFCYVPPDGDPDPSPDDCNKLEPMPVGSVPVALSRRCLRYDLGKRTTRPISILNSIGALKVQDFNYPNAGKEFWASGVVIGKDIKNPAVIYYATACHPLFSLFDQAAKGYIPAIEEHYTIRKGINLYVDFSISSEKPMEVSATFLTCAHPQGLDVALLKLNVGGTWNGRDISELIPSPLPLLYEADSSAEMKTKAMAFVAYGDLRHPIDEATGEMYYPASHGSSSGAYQKFAMWDPVVGRSKCYGVNYLMDDASSTVGSSGGVVLDVFKDYDETNPSLKLRAMPLAAGIHKCCSAYFENERAAAEEQDNSCAWMHRTPLNQDISSTSILHENNFCTYLKDNVEIRDNDDKQYVLDCSKTPVAIVGK